MPATGTQTIATIDRFEQLDSLVSTSAIFALGFVSEPTSVLAKQFERIRAGYPRAVFALAVLPRAEPLAKLFGVAEAPALVLFREGLGLYAGPASFDDAQLDRLLGRVCALDIDAARRQIEQERLAEAALATRRVCPTARRGPVA